MGNNLPASRRSEADEQQQQSTQRVISVRFEDVQPAYSRIGDASKTYPSLSIQRACVLENPASLKLPTLALTQDKQYPQFYHISFKYDATVNFEIKLYYVCYLRQEKLCKIHSFETLNGDPPHSRIIPPGLDREYHTSLSEALDVSKYDEATLIYEQGTTLYPIVIELNSFTDNQTPRSERTMASLYRKEVSSNALEPEWDIRMIKQEFQWDDGVFEMQRVYGIAGTENGILDDASTALVNGRECVICLNAKRTTAVLPCRHMCLCDDCANIMRIQSDKCPICRQRVSCLLQLEVDSPKTSTSV